MTNLFYVSCYHDDTRNKYHHQYQQNHVILDRRSYGLLSTHMVVHFLFVAWIYQITTTTTTSSLFIFSTRRPKRTVPVALLPHSVVIHTIFFLMCVQFSHSQNNHTHTQTHASDNVRCMSSVRNDFPIHTDNDWLTLTI